MPPDDERDEEGRVTFPSDRREDRGSGRPAWRDARPCPRAHPRGSARDVQLPQERGEPCVRAEGIEDAVVPELSPADTACSATWTSRMLGKRAAGSFSRQRLTTRVRPSGRSARRDVRSGDVSRRIAEPSSAVDPPPNGRRPLAISWRRCPSGGPPVAPRPARATCRAPSPSRRRPASVPGWKGPSPWGRRPASSWRGRKGLADHGASSPRGEVGSGLRPVDGTGPRRATN